MKYTVEVTSINSQATEWVLIGLKRNNSGDILKDCEKTAKEIKMMFEEIEDKLVFKDKVLQ